VDPYRLPRHVRPTRYDLRLEPDLATLTFTGDQTVTLEVDEPTSEVVLNAVDLAFGEATLTGMLLTLGVIYRPRWIATYDIDRYLPRPTR